MMYDSEFWRRAALLFATVGQCLFITLYLFFPWWKTYLGRALFVKASTLGALLVTITIGITVDWRYEEAMRAFLNVAVALAIWGQVIAFFRVRAQGRQDNLGESNE